MAAKLCACCGQPITVGGPGRRYLPGHAWNSARAINPESFSPADLDRYWSFVRLADNGQCWEWTGPRQNGYGSIRLGRRNASKLFAHRVMWALTHGPLPGIVEILHRCATTGLGPRCVRPAHLFEGDHSVNALDAAANGTLCRRLSASQVLELRSLHAAGRSMKSLARQFGVARYTVELIVTRRSWRHLNDGDFVQAPKRPAGTCPQGHPYDGSYHSNGHTYRGCSICRRAANRRFTVRRAAARTQAKASAGA